MDESKMMKKKLREEIEHGMLFANLDGNENPINREAVDKALSSPSSRFCLKESRTCVPLSNLSDPGTLPPHRALQRSDPETINLEHRPELSLIGREHALIHGLVQHKNQLARDRCS